MKRSRFLVLYGLVLPGLRGTMAVTHVNYHLGTDVGTISEGVGLLGGSASMRPWSCDLAACACS
jgi:hypothetical protein